MVAAVGRQLGNVESSCAVIAFCPVRDAHFFDPNHSAGPGGVDKAVVAHINTDVRVAASERIKKHQIAYLQIVALDGLANFGHFGCLARHF